MDVLIDPRSLSKNPYVKEETNEKDKSPAPVSIFAYLHFSLGIRTRAGSNYRRE